jgi:hypothetical protein
VQLKSACGLIVKHLLSESAPLSQSSLRPRASRVKLCRPGAAPQALRGTLSADEMVAMPLACSSYLSTVWCHILQAQPTPRQHRDRTPHLVFLDHVSIIISALIIVLSLYLGWMPSVSVHSVQSGHICYRPALTGDAPPISVPKCPIDRSVQAACRRGSWQSTSSDEPDVPATSPEFRRIHAIIRTIRS